MQKYIKAGQSNILGMKDLCLTILVPNRTSNSSPEKKTSNILTLTVLQPHEKETN